MSNLEWVLWRYGLWRYGWLLTVLHCLSVLLGKMDVSAELLDTGQAALAAAALTDSRAFGAAAMTQARLLSKLESGSPRDRRCATAALLHCFLPA